MKKEPLRRQTRYMLLLALLTGVCFACTQRQQVQPNVLPTAAKQTVQVIETEAITAYFVQMAGGDTPELAQVSAARYAQRGSAGYVLSDDTGHHVLARMEFSEQAARDAAEQLNAQGLEAECIPMVSRSVRLQVTASDAQRGALEKLRHALDMACVQPGEIAYRLETNALQSGEARGYAAMLVRDLETALSDFRQTGVSGALADAMISAAEGAVRFLEPLAAENGEGKLLLAGRLRNVGICIWFLRRGIFEAT